MMIKRCAGTVSPDEYNWKEQFSLDPSEIGVDPYILMDVGKVRGLAIALEEAEKRIAELEKKNTFWACERHTNNNTLRCAICDEERIAELEANEKEWKEYAMSWQDTNTKLEAENEQLKRKWKHGSSGCACLITEEDEIINQCLLHKDAEIAAAHDQYKKGLSKALWLVQSRRIVSDYIYDEGTIKRCEKVIQAELDK
jgi:hypothetical protein